MNRLAAGTPAIISHIRLLVAVIVIVALVALGLILWQAHEHDKISGVSTRYHEESSRHIGVIHIEFLTIRAYLRELASQNAVNLSHVDLLSTDHGMVKSLHIIKQSADRILSIHKKHQDPKFNILKNKLQEQLDPFLSLIDISQTGTNRESWTHVNNIDAILLTLMQFDRLHVIENREMKEQARRHEQTRISIILSTILVLMLAGFFVIKNTFYSIRAILRKQQETEDALLREKGLIHTTLNSIGDAVITTDNSGLVTSMNPIAEQLTGWLLHEARGLPLKTIFPIINASTRKPMEDPAEKVITTGEIIYLSNYSTLTAKDGTEYQIADSAAPIQEDGHILGMVLVFNDITDQYQLRHAAAKSRRDLQSILDNSPAVIYVKDIEGRYTFVNQKYVELFHIKRDDIIGKTDHDIFPDNIAVTFQRNDIEVLESGHALESEEVAPHDDGLHTYISIKFPLVNELGNVYAVCGISTDITERKKMEEDILSSAQHLRLYREQTPMATIEWNTDFQVLDWNLAAEKMFGYKVEEVKGRDFVDLMLPESAVVDVKQIWQDLMTQSGGELSINENLTRDGRVILCEWHNTPLKDESGKIIGAASIVQDITERKQHEEQLRRSQKMDALGKLTGGIAHDYNNLLGIIQGYAEQLNEQLTDDSRLAKYAQDIQHAAERGAKLTKKLLAFSQHKAPDAITLNINKLLQEQHLMLEKTLTARIKLVYDLAHELWLVDMDSSDFEDAIVNMSINALHAMKEGGELTFRTCNEQLNTIDAQMLNLDAGDYVLLSITDTGCGMDEITQEKLFEPFFSTKGEQGTGLGLSQVYGFVERSGGQIKVYSEPEHGSRFALYFPRSQQVVTEARAPALNVALDLYGNETLLVVDDEQAMVELAYDILTTLGYRVLTANDGEQALAVLEKESVDLVITDVIMPNMDGYQLAAYIQQHYPRTKIQMISGFADDRHQGMTDDTLHQNMLYKPYTSRTLLERVRRLLDEGSTQDTLTGRTVLVMDDEEHIRELFKINLAKLGCKTIPACDGDEAIARYQQSLESEEPIDITILDLSIPGSLNGKDIAAKIWALDPGAKIIVTSGHSMGQEMTQYQDFGFNGAIEKNFDREEIKRVLELVLA